MSKIRITFTILSLLILLPIIGYQIHFETSLYTTEKDNYLHLINRNRKRVSLYLIYEVVRMLNIDFQANESKFVNCFFKNKELSYWEPRMDYYVMHLFFSDLEKEEIIKNCSLYEKTVRIALVENNLLNLNSHLWAETTFLITNSTETNLYLPINEAGYVEYGYAELEFCDNREGNVSFRDFRTVNYQTIIANSSGFITLFRERDLKFGKYSVTDSTGIKLELMLSDSCAN